VLLRANQKPQHLLASTLAGSVVGLISAFPLSRLWGIWGATSSILLSTLAAAITTIIFYAIHRRENALAEQTIELAR
jgi:O-antigen/teichoic acid export membrane protein